jgi:hypothetical protein
MVNVPSVPRLFPVYCQHRQHSGLFMAAARTAVAAAVASAARVQLSDGVHHVGEGKA